MKIKKRDLRKGLAQLPINYPAPTVEDVFIFEKEKHRVEDICKKLAHVEVEVRDAALAEMPRYLKEICDSYVSSNGAVADADVELLLQKLAMGLFYCFWHSDKPLVQHECAHKIAQLMNTVPNLTMQRLIVESIFRILSREWGRIDRYRLDKYMSLVRKLVYQLLMLIKRHYREALRKAHGEDEKITETDNTTEVAEEGVSEAEKTDKAEQTALSIPFITHLTTFFQKTLLVEPRSVGLTMHMMDVILDELIRSDVDVALFVRMSEMIPLFAMSRGDFIEKKVLDNFIGPIVSGVLDARRVHTIATSPETIKEAERKKKKIVSEDAEQAARNYSDENDQICIRLATSCKLLSVDRNTRHNVRPMLSEAQMLIEQHLAVKLNPKQFRRLTHRDMRRRVTKELQEAEEAADKTMKFRKLVKDERREVKKKARKLVSRDQSGIGKKQLAKGGKKDGKKHIVIDDADAAGHEQPAKKKDINPLAARALRKKLSSDKNISEKVKEEVVKLARKEERRQAKSHRLEAGESESKISAKGNSQNSKRHKYGKLSHQDIVAMEKEETPVWKRKK